MTQSENPTDDWTALRQSVQDLKELMEEDGQDGRMLSSFGDIDEADVFLIVTLVPKLLDAYADLWELSIALTKAVEQWKSEGQGGKLLVADEHEVRQFN